VSTAADADQLAGVRSFAGTDDADIAAAGALAIDGAI
jgi:hypothetical protein